MIDLATYFHSSIAKVEEKMKIHDKIQDFSTNLGKNPLLTLLLHVSLSKNVLSLYKSEKYQKQRMGFSKNERNAIYMAESVLVRLSKRRTLQANG